eukprot:m.1155826 g.1155826  ORF g.1155826 m.1155826 type:complete len:59 (-) comp24491_c0_seq21:3192-3368(-)
MSTILMSKVVWCYGSDEKTSAGLHLGVAANSNRDMTWNAKNNTSIRAGNFNWGRRVLS